jgi:hypothetical protein
VIVPHRSSVSAKLKLAATQALPFRGHLCPSSAFARMIVRASWGLIYFVRAGGVSRTAAGWGVSLSHHTDSVRKHYERPARPHLDEQLFEL